MTAKFLVLLFLASLALVLLPQPTVGLCCTPESNPDVIEQCCKWKPDFSSKQHDGGDLAGVCGDCSPRAVVDKSCCMVADGNIFGCECNHCIPSQCPLMASSMTDKWGGGGGKAKRSANPGFQINAKLIKLSNSRAYAQNQLDKVDKDGDGFIDFAEFMKEFGNKFLNNGNPVGTLRIEFQKMDKDGNGVIELIEIDKDAY